MNDKKSPPEQSTVIAYNETRIHIYAQEGRLEIICPAGFDCQTETLPMSVKFSKEDSGRILLSIKKLLESGAIELSQSSKTEDIQ